MSNPNLEYADRRVNEMLRQDTNSQGSNPLSRPASMDINNPSNPVTAGIYGQGANMLSPSGVNTPGFGAPSNSMPATAGVYGGGAPNMPTTRGVYGPAGNNNMPTTQGVYGAGNGMPVTQGVYAAGNGMPVTQGVYGAAVNNMQTTQSVYGAGSTSPILIRGAPISTPPTEMNTTSKIQYKPYQRKVVELQQKYWVEKVPKTKKIIQHRDEIYHEVIPREVTKKDYYAVEYIKEYVPEYIPERTVKMVQKPVPYKRIQYVPVTRQVYHGAPLGNMNTNLDGLSLASTGNNLPGHGFNHSIANADSFAGVSSFYNGYSGDFFQPNYIPILPTTNFREIYAGRFGNTAAGLHANTGLMGGRAGLSTTAAMNNYRWKMSTVDDTYDHYVPSFKY